MSPYPESHPVYVCREQKQWTLKELSEACGISVPALSTIEHGRIPAEPKRREIARALGVTTDYLWPPGSGV